ncbi:hypothetical protein T492DRAFT_1109648 [Pavlovales sp. CCMP2436]|nr:hypothetical protein T492DRAFT_1109648 [Pavlovales sp. CCMP2436]|mmetsp:Transcript_38909/g.91355  ORF Transcript_38909/g.91355 Transcript_38909/m.91355 type:complete len:152 (-) Transcript_38909:362-817(-)
MSVGEVVLASMERSQRVSTFLKSRPQTPKAVRSWLEIHPADAELSANGLAELLNRLLRAVLLAQPVKENLPQFALAVLDGSAPDSSGGSERYLGGHGVRAVDTQSALTLYVAEHRVMEFFQAMLKTAIIELRGEQLDSTEWAKQYLGTLSS